MSHFVGCKPLVLAAGSASTRSEKKNGVNLTPKNVQRITPKRLSQREMMHTRQNKRLVPLFWFASTVLFYDAVHFNR